MNEIQLRTQLRATLMNQVEQIMAGNNISAMMMEDALVYVLNTIKDLTLQDYVSANIQKEQEALEQVEEVDEGE